MVEKYSIRQRRTATEYRKLEIQIMWLDLVWPAKSPRRKSFPVVNDRCSITDSLLRKVSRIWPHIIACTITKFNKNFVNVFKNLFNPLVLLEIYGSVYLPTRWFLAGSDWMTKHGFIRRQLFLVFHGLNVQALSDVKVTCYCFGSRPPGTGHY